MGLFSRLRDKIHTSCKKSKDTSLPSKPYKDGRYKVSQHGVDRMNERQITKGELHVNLHTTPLHKTNVEIDKKGRPAYVRYSKNRTRAVINPKNKNVASVRRYRDKELNKSKRK